jgi:choline-glycine betaine transporter
MVIILTATIVTLTGFGIFGNNAQGQGNLTKGNVTLTPEQVASICNPDNPKLNFVNTTESKICGIPKTITNMTSANMTTANTTTGEEEAPPSSTSIAPSANTTTGEEEAPPEGIAPSAVPPS